MSEIYDKLAHYGSAPAEERLIVLRVEVLRCNSFVGGYAELILDEISKGNCPDLPTEVTDWIQHVIDKSKDISQIIYALTDK
jgi:hypothetical protein